MMHLIISKYKQTERKLSVTVFTHGDGGRNPRPILSLGPQFPDVCDFQLEGYADNKSW